MSSSSVVRESYQACSNDFGKLSDVASIFSFIFASTTFIILIRQPRYSSFPHNLPPFITISVAIMSIGRAIGHVASAQLRHSTILCSITGFVTAVGVLAMRFWWIASLIVLYAAVVKRYSVIQIKRHKLRFYSAVIGTTLVLLLVPLTWSGITYWKSRGRCWYDLSPTANFLVFDIHGVVAASVFLAVGPPVIKTMLSNTEMLPSPRSRMLREEALRQVLLGFVMFSMTVIRTFRGIHSYVYKTSKDDGGWFIESTTYSSCAAAYVFFGFLGIVIILIYVVSRKTFSRIGKSVGKIRSVIKSWCCSKEEENSSTTSIADDVEDGVISVTAFIQEPKTPIVKPPSPRTLLHSKTIYDEYHHGA